MPARTHVLLPSGSRWELRGITPGGMLRLLSADETASSLTYPPDGPLAYLRLEAMRLEVLRLRSYGAPADLRRASFLERELRASARPLLAQRGPEYDSDDWQTLELEAIVELLEAHQEAPR